MNPLSLPIHVIEGEPRVLDTNLAEELAMADLHKVRPLIRSHRDELEELDPLSARRAEITGPGRPGHRLLSQRTPSGGRCASVADPKGATPTRSGRYL